MFSKIKEKLSFALIAAPIYAQETIKIEPGPEFGKEVTSITIGGIVSGAISLAMLGVALVFFFMLIFGGLKWVMAGGDEKKVGEARGQITNALVGLVIVFAAFAIMKLIETIFGIKLLGGISIPTFNR